MMGLIVSEDTFTPWADRKLEGLESFEEELLTLLANVLLEETDPLVPVASASLQMSAHYLWQWTRALPSMGLALVWSGLTNPNYEEFDLFKNKNHEDYALSVYYGERYADGKPASKSHWLDSLDDLYAVELQDKLEEMFIGYLNK